LGNNRITRLTGLEWLENLEVLKLYNNKIIELGELESLVKLGTLDIRGNNLNDLNLLKKLKNLIRIYIDKDQLKAVGGIDWLIQLVPLLDPLFKMMYSNQ